MLLWPTIALASRGRLHPEARSYNRKQEVGSLHLNSLSVVIGGFPLLNRILPAFMGKLGCCWPPPISRVPSSQLLVWLNCVLVLQPVSICLLQRPHTMPGLGMSLVKSVVCFSWEAAFVFPLKVYLFPPTIEMDYTTYWEKYRRQKSHLYLKSGKAHPSLSVSASLSALPTHTCLSTTHSCNISILTPRNLMNQV